MNARYWVVTDLETSGTQPWKRHEILQIARVVYDAQAREVVPESEVMAYVRPQAWDARSREAGEVHGLTDFVWLYQNGVPLRKALQQWEQGVDWTQSVVAAWGIDFEAKFLEASYARVSRMPPYPYSMVDLRTLAYAAADLQELHGLATVARGWGLPVSDEGLHDALYDVQLAVRVLRESRLRLEH